MRDETATGPARGAVNRARHGDGSGMNLEPLNSNEQPTEAGACSSSTLLATHDALALADLVRRREISAIELLETAIREVEKFDPRFNFMAQRHYDYARSAIARGLPDGPFSGVPFLLKDLSIYLQGEITGEGSRYFSGNRANFSSELALRYERAGLVIFGKTTTPELGTVPTTEPLVTGPTRNPWNSELIAGGSSGGSAVAVATRVVPFAHASDGGGSIRIPSSCCGVFGLKPSRGRVPVGPTPLDQSDSLTVHHAITRSVRDSAALLDATHGPEAGSRYSAPPPARPFVDEVNSDSKGLRIAIRLTPSQGADLDGECVEAAIAAARLCESLGHHVEEAAPDIDLAAMQAALYPVVGARLAAFIEAHAERTGIAPSSELLEPTTEFIVNQGLTRPAIDCAKAESLFQDAAIRMAQFMRNYDVILSPTLGSLPLPIGAVGPHATDVEAVRAAVFRMIPFTSLMNQTGQPSMSVPLATSRSGLPIGIMFSARFGEEATLLRLAGQLERAAPWEGRRPPLN